MNILFVNGSPSGKNSITLQTALYLQNLFPEHSYSHLDAGQRIKAIQKDFEPARKALSEADLIIFVYPVYTFIATSQMHTFIRLIKENDMDLNGKTASQITTSKHFYDITAHNYIKENCFDLGLSFVEGLSADMDDLLKEKGQRQARTWFSHLVWCVENNLFERPIIHSRHSLVETVDVPKTKAEPKNDKDVVILVDSTNTNSTLNAMVERFRAKVPYRTRVVDLGTFPFKGGCLGCFHCAPDGKCIYKDGFDDFLRNTIHRHDAILYAFRIQDHSMGSRFKMYDDRQFCNGHRTVTMGTPFGYLVAGDYSREENLRLLLEARAQVGGNFLAGVATDEGDVDRDIDTLAATVAYAMEKQYTPPQNFYGVGGMKIFRDLIYLMRGLMRADHKFFKSHGQYDFPQKKWKTSWKMYPVGWLMRSPALKRKIGSRMTEGMIAPYKKILQQTDTR